MVTPIYIIAIALGTAFGLGFFSKAGKGIATGLFYAALTTILGIAAQWLLAFLTQGQTVTEVFTSGFKPPFSISLQMGLNEAVILSMINLTGLLGGIYLFDMFKKYGVYLMITYLLLIMGLDVIVMTRDIFNLFVFLEIASIAMAGMALITNESKSVQAGFKYLTATAIISSFLLIGIMLAYRFGNSLYINDLLVNDGITKAGLAVTFLIIMPLILELKPFPANGWGLDMYQATHPAVGSLLSAASVTASLFVLWKLVPMVGVLGANIIAILGIITFLGSNIAGLKQSNARRMLGYSSIAQTGLIVTVIGLHNALGSQTVFVAFSILITHFLAKSGLFWLRGIVGTDNLKAWGLLRNNPILLFLFVLFIVALTGLPPFPAFFGKWELIMALANTANPWWIAMILIGSFLEAVYLFRWVGYGIKDKSSDEKIDTRIFKHIPIYIVAAGLIISIGFYLHHYYPTEAIFFMPLVFAAILFALDFLPAKLKNIISIIGMGGYAYYMYDHFWGIDNLRFFFAIIFIVGGILTLLPGFTKSGKRLGFYPAALLMFAGLGMLIFSTDLLQFFIAWEIMTIGSYLLIIRGKNSLKHAFSYMLFSLGGAFAMLAGFAFAQTGNIGIGLDVLSNMNYLPGLSAALIAIGFMTKTASLGLHIWLPGAHAEAESDVSPMVSAILLKAGVFGLILLFIGIGAEAATNHPLTYILGWLGALTALIGNMGAAFQEDAKRLLAWSSIGQLGYILFAFSIMTHLGWLAGLTYTANHAAFKAILFLGIGGVVFRTKTHNMFEMGGLIKKMPLTFITVLFAIITLAGIPPLAGFAGKWLFYNAVIMKTWYLQGTIVFFAGIVAFLYSFRILYAVFLGHLKDHHRKIKEAPIWFLIPQFLLMGFIMLFSMQPELILRPFGEMVSSYFPSDALVWDNGTALTSLGYWNGFRIGVIIFIMFAILFGWLYITSRKVKKIKAFNIVYAGEMPERPETTHMAHNMFAGYNKALGFLVAPGITNFWRYVDNSFHDLGDSVRKIYSGNTQSYLIQLVAYTVIVFMLINFSI
jgi:formate hydrogenlyase subunit 3/multisubunit Na+/H+ antiporter MnhD subunit